MSKMTAAFVVLGLMATGPAAQAGGVAPVKIVDSDHGKVLIDDRGRTLYTLDKDEGGTSRCTWLCAAVWPPLKAQVDIRPSEPWSVVARDSGDLQWAYRGRPLYRYRRDARPGDIVGDGVEGTWHVARP